MLYIALFSFALGAGQAPLAERFFKKGDYINAALHYEEVLKTKRSKIALERLSDCYYNTFDYQNGIQSVKAIVEGNFLESDKTVDARFNFMYYQLLSAVGDYEKALGQLAVYKGKTNQQLPNVPEAMAAITAFQTNNAHFEIKKAKFNSEASDFAAVELSDTIYFSSDRGDQNESKKEYKWTHRPFLDLYAVGKETSGEFSNKAIAMPASINSNLHEGSFTFGNKGATLYFSRSNLVNGKKVFNTDKRNQVQLYVSQNIKGKWTAPKKLPFCADDFNYQHPSLSDDGKTLYFSSDQPGSLGSYDIFAVGIDANGNFGTPYNLGDTINTKEREQYPYISSEGHLFFASNGHFGLGLLDLFVSESKNGEFTAPINLGAPINSSFDDFSLAYSTKDKGFFSSNRDANDDIFAFGQTGPLFGKAQANHFEIREENSGEFVKNTVVIVRNDLGNEVYNNNLYDESTFMATLELGTYHIEMRSPGFETKTAEVFVTATSKVHVLTLRKLYDLDPITKDVSDASKKTIIALLNDVNVPTIFEKEGKLYFNVLNIYFDFDQYEIRAGSHPILNNLASKLQQYPTLKIKINSHTDSRGSAIYNQHLSEKRAQALSDYLIKLSGVSADRISFKGYGESMPVIDCGDACSEKEHHQNRRSQFEIVEY